MRAIAIAIAMQCNASQWPIPSPRPPPHVRPRTRARMHARAFTPKCVCVCVTFAAKAQCNGCGGVTVVSGCHGVCKGYYSRGDSDPRSGDPRVYAKEEARIPLCDWDLKRKEEEGLENEKV